MPALPWLIEPLWDQFAALLPTRPVVDPADPLGYHRGRISDRVVFDKLVQMLRFGCSYEAIADTTCSGDHDPQPPQRVDRPGHLCPTPSRSRWSPTTGSWAWCWGSSQSTGASHRARRRGRRELPDRPGKQGVNAPTWSRATGSRWAGLGRHQPARLPAASPHVGHAGRPGYAAREDHCAPGCRLRPRATRAEIDSRSMRGEIAHTGDKAPTRPDSAGTSNAPTPGRTPSTGCDAATNAPSPSSTRSSTSRHHHHPT